MVAQEQRPLAVVGDRRGLGQDVDDGEAVLHADRHEQARHEREVEGGVALVAAAEVGHRVLRPLVGLRQQHLVRVAAVDVGAQVLEGLVRLGEVLAVGALALEQVGHRVQSNAVDAHVEPEVTRPEDGLLDARVLEVQVGLVRVEAVPVVGARDLVPRPVGDLEVLEDDARVLVALVGAAPDVEVAIDAARPRAARALEPGVLVGRVVADQLGDDADAAAMRFLDELMHVAEVAEHRVDARVVGDVVAVVAER